MKELLTPPPSLISLLHTLRYLCKIVDIWLTPSPWHVNVVYEQRWIRQLRIFDLANLVKSTWIDSNQIDSTWLESTQIGSKSLKSIRIDSNWHGSTWIEFIWINLNHFDGTLHWIDLDQLESIWLLFFFFFWKFK